MSRSSLASLCSWTSATRWLRKLASFWMGFAHTLPVLGPSESPLPFHCNFLAGPAGSDGHCAVPYGTVRDGHCATVAARRPAGPRGGPPRPRRPGFRSVNRRCRNWPASKRPGLPPHPPASDSAETPAAPPRPGVRRRPGRPRNPRPGPAGPVPDWLAVTRSPAVTLVDREPLLRPSAAGPAGPGRHTLTVTRSPLHVQPASETVLICERREHCERREL